MTQGGFYHHVPNVERKWRGHWCKCFGPQCSPEDCTGCCMACSIPGITYSWNVSKVLNLPFWRELAKFVCALWLGAGLYILVSSSRMAACFPVLEFDLDTGTPDIKAKDSATCKALSTLEPLLWLLFASGTLCWALFVGGPSRRRMRLALGIPITREGTCCKACHCNNTFCNDDCCLHFWCMTCALAQETRTILHEEAIGSIKPRLLGGGYSLVTDGLPLVAPPHVVVEADAGVSNMELGTKIRSKDLHV